MYPAYYPYLYQRGAGASVPRPTFPSPFTHQLDRVSCFNSFFTSRIKKRPCAGGAAAGIAHDDDCTKLLNTSKLNSPTYFLETFPYLIIIETIINFLCIVKYQYLGVAFGFWLPIVPSKHIRVLASKLHAIIWPLNLHRLDSRSTMLGAASRFRREPSSKNYSCISFFGISLVFF